MFPKGHAANNVTQGVGGAFEVIFVCCGAQPTCLCPLALAGLVVLCGVFVIVAFG